MSVKRYEVALNHEESDDPEAIMISAANGSYVRHEEYAESERYGRQADITIENLEQKLAESQREFRAADATIENMQMQLDKLAAENAGLKAENAEGCKWDGEQWVGLSNETPATDAFLAEVRAQGVDVAIEELNQLAERSEKEAPIAAEHHRSAALYLQLLAAQIRKGVQS